MQAEVVSKGEFAALIGVSPGRVSQMLKEGAIGPEALDGVGRMARIKVAVARAHLRDRLDPSQRFGNGLSTRLDDDAPAPLLNAQTSPAGAQDATSDGDPRNSVEAQIKREKLREVQYRNRKAAEDEALRKGTLVPADEAQARIAAAAAKTMQLFEGATANIASAMAAQFKVPQRDVLHLLRNEYRRVRERAAKEQSCRRDALPETVETTIETDE